ncbi:hypothetical protein DNTS_015895 [Danionella cerebrum]|uniref:Scaffolding anchor of CK1 domain-containing protein n=1 Tax=Danionella cerebrum TaxID=2873325 RepID=A0A553NMA8_9TELE|nr:hypothetical protein DNTS_015895 [Danionella translucida]
MALSQSLEDSIGWRTPRKDQDANIKELYNERHRLALEELVAGGVECYRGFLQKERIPNFLSDDEIRAISSVAVVPKSVQVTGEDSHLDQTGTMDCSSVTYFPEVSDIEPPMLEMGWPAFTTGSYRGVTRAVAYFQPSYGDCIYSCKEAARRMIKSAKEVIAIVSDSLTDLDIFHDLQEACTQRRVPVYILLDQTSATSFLQMCKNLHVHLDELLHMKVRTITGSTYYMRSGARITGKVHERFMLIDGNRVATGSYRFNWTDGKLNSSNLIELSGQITEKFDEEFRILYAQSLPLPVNTKAPYGAKISSLYDHLVLKPPTTPLSYLLKTKHPVGHLTSTPTRLHFPETQPTRKDIGEKNQESKSEDVELPLTCVDPPRLPITTVTTQTQTGDVICPVVSSCDISTQTSSQTVHTSVQTNSIFQKPNPKLQLSARSSPQEVDGHVTPQDIRLRECFLKISSERQHHYSSIRTKLEHMVMLLSQRRELLELSSIHRGQGVPPEATLAHTALDKVIALGNWPTSRCLQ